MDITKIISPGILISMTLTPIEYIRDVTHLVLPGGQHLTSKQELMREFKPDEKKLVILGKRNTKITKTFLSPFGVRWKCLKVWETSICNPSQYVGLKRRLERGITSSFEETRGWLFLTTTECSDSLSMCIFSKKDHEIELISHPYAEEFFNQANRADRQCIYYIFLAGRLTDADGQLLPVRYSLIMSTHVRRFVKFLEEVINKPIDLDISDLLPDDFYVELSTTETGIKVISTRCVA